MNKTEFLNELDICLKRMQKEEREKFITYYDEMIADYIEDGMTEEDAVQKIGSPDAVAKEILSEADTVILPIPNINNKIVLAILLILGFPLWGSLLLAALLMLLSVYIVLWCIPFATGMSAFTFFAVSLVSIIGSPFVMVSGFSVGVTQLGLGIASFGLSVLLAFATIPLAKEFALKTTQVTKYFFNVMKRSLKP